MRLSVPDRNEFMKAAVKAPDRESLVAWIVSVVDAVDELPEGKSDAQCPRYRLPGTAEADSRASANGQAMLTLGGDRLAT